MVSYVELLPCCIQPSKAQAYALPLACQISHRESIWPQADELQNDTLALWQTLCGTCLENDDIQILYLDLERTFIRIPSIPVFPSALLHKEPIDAHCHGLFFVSANLICAKVRRASDLSTSRIFGWCHLYHSVSFWFCSWSLRFIILFQQPSKRSWIWQLEGVSFTLHVLHLLKIKLFRCQGCRLNEHDISASIFADLYPMSAFLTIRGDNDDTPCVCLSPFQRFSNEVLRSPQNHLCGAEEDAIFITCLWGQWRRLFCESRDRHIVMDLLHFGQLVRYDGFSALPLTAINWASSRTRYRYIIS